MSELSCTVYEPVKPDKNLVARSDNLVFVRDGFSLWAMMGSVFWLAMHRLWIPLAGFIGLFVILTGLARLAGASPDAGAVLYAGLSIALGFLGNDIRRMMLERQGYRMIAAITGPSQIECERRFYHNWLPFQESKAGEETA